MQIVNDAELAKLTSKELQDLQARIEDAIRAAIRAKNMAKIPAPKPAADAPKVIDLERERDAWLMAKR